MISPTFKNNLETSLQLYYYANVEVKRYWNFNDRGQFYFGLKQSTVFESWKISNSLMSFIYDVGFERRKIEWGKIDLKFEIKLQ